jgi:hypothetical protein
VERRKKIQGIPADGPSPWIDSNISLTFRLCTNLFVFVMYKLILYYIQIPS